MNTIERLFWDSKSKSGLGNFKPTVATLFGQEHIAPRYLTSYQELARQHSGKTKPSGSDILEVRRNLKLLSEKPHIFIMRGKPDKNGRRRVIVDHARIVNNLLEGFEDLTKAEEQRVMNGNTADLRTLKKGQILITGNPIFAIDIDTKYILKPSDINERIRDASGSNRPTKAISKLSSYLLRQITDPITKRTAQHEIGEDKLIYALGLDKYQKEGRKKLVIERIDGAFKACSHARLPLIQSVIKESDKFGNPKYVFTLNLGFPTPVTPLESEFPLQAAES